MNMDEEDINIDYFKDNPHSYGGRYRLYKVYGKEYRDKVDNALAYNDIFTRFKQYKRTKTYSPIYVYKKRELFQSDVVFFTNDEMVKANAGFRYLFTCIDVFSKMAWVYPMKDNKCQTVMNCFKDILSKCGEKPERLNSDRGSELICKKFENFLIKNNIYHYLSYSERKCPVIERFNLTIQRIIYKMMAKQNSMEWTKFLNSAMKIYLNRTHRTIKMSPLDAEEDENQIKVRRTYFEKYVKANLKQKNPKFRLGDSVRIWKKRGTFHRGYMEDFTREHFIITKVLTNLPVPRYKLKDYNDEEIVGSFFENELVLYNPSEFYESQVIKKRKTKKNGLEYLIHYIGYPRSMDQWVKVKDLKKL